MLRKENEEITKSVKSHSTLEMVYFNNSDLKFW